MSAPSVALQVPKPRRGWAPMPHCVADTLTRQLADLPLRAMIQILNETARHNGEYAWTRMNVAFYAYRCNATESDMGKALRQLEKPPEAGGYGLLRSKRAGRMKVYQFIPERIQSLGNRKRRTLRKPVQSAEYYSENTANEHQGGAKTESVEMAEVVEMKVAVNRGCDSPSLQCLAESVESGATDRVPPPGSIDESRVTSTDESSSAPDELEDFCVLHDTSKPNTCPETNYKSGVDGQEQVPTLDRRLAFPDSESETLDISLSERLRDTCISTLTPKLLSIPPSKILDRTMKALGSAPLHLLEAIIVRRHSVVTSWGLLPLFAEQAAQAHSALSIVRKRHPVQYDLTADWASAAHVRSLYSSADTPEAVKAELILMWPELDMERRQRRKTGDDFSERMIAVGRHQREVARKAKEREQEQEKERIRLREEREKRDHA